MPINLSNVNVSLDQFQKMASGDYNAGEVALKSESKLVKINNHVHRISANTKSISHEEVLAIKDAFVRALQSNGVSDKGKIDEIRKELGLAPDETAPKSLAERSIKPLTRQQIRDIIDRNATAINASRAERGEKAFKTSAQLYGNDKTKLDALAESRRAASDSVRRTLTESADIANFQKIVEGNAAEVAGDDRGETLKTILAQRDAIVANAKGNPGTEGNCTLEFTTEAGQKILFSSSKSERETIRMLDEAYLFLDGGGTVRERNGMIAASLVNPNKEFMPFEFLEMAKSVRAEATAIFGKEAVEQSDEAIQSLVDSRLELEARKLSDEGTAMTAENFRAAYRANCFEKSVSNLVDRTVAGLLREMGRDVSNATRIRSDLGKIMPETFAALAEATTADAVQTILDGAMGRIRETTVKQVALLDAQDKLEASMNEAFAKEMGVKWGPGSGKLANFSYLASKEGDALVGDIATGKVKADTPGEIKAEFKKLAQRTAHAHAEFLRGADALGLSGDAVDRIKEHLLHVSSLKRLDLGKAKALAGEIDVKPLADAVAAKAPMEKIFAEIGKVHGSASQKIRTLYEGAAEIGAEEEFTGLPVLFFMALDKVPGLAARLEKFLSGDDVRNAIEADEEVKLPSAVYDAAGFLKPSDLAPAQLAATLGEPDMKPLFAQALVKAADEAGLAQLSPEKKLALFADGTAAGRVLREALGAMPPDMAPTPDFLYGLARGAFRDIDIAGLLAPHAETAKLFAQDAAMQAKVLAAGYHKSELPMLANAFALIKSATGCSDAAALEKTLDPQSRERRLFGYGGRFAASPENFGKGLSLMGKFGGWYQGVSNAVRANKNNLHNVPNPTVRNADSNYLAPDMLKAYEKFLFEEIAANDSLPLVADDLDKVFGMEANPAMRFVGRGYTTAINDTVARMPVEARQILYAAFDAMLPLATDAAGLRENSIVSGVTMPIARVMRNLDGLRQLQKAGDFTAQNVKTLLFPEVPDAGTKSLKAITDEIDGRASRDFITDMPSLMRVVTMMQSSGCTYDEVVAANKEGRILPPAPHILSGTGQLNDLDGTARGARKQAVGDLIRPSIPDPVRGGAPLLQPQNRVFTVNFPDGTVLTAGDSPTDAENTVRANAIADKVEALVGVKHQAQLASAMIGLSQSAHGPFLDNSATLGFVNKAGAEHAAITYTFARNDDTGEITIRYSEPQGFPKKFHWETTIALDGSATTTPLVVDE